MWRNTHGSVMQIGRKQWMGMEKIIKKCNYSLRCVFYGTSMCVSYNLRWMIGSDLYFSSMSVLGKKLTYIVRYIGNRLIIWHIWCISTVTYICSRWLNSHFKSEPWINIARFASFRWKLSIQAYFSLRMSMTPFMFLNLF